MKDFLDKDFWRTVLATVVGGVVLYFVMRMMKK